MATHSLDVLLGLAHTRPERTLIVRLTRADGVTFARMLPPSKLAELWRDPLLRFSRALDGLFHDAVIVCEGDTDCQFYSAVAEHIASSDWACNRDIMFSYAGSKHRISLVTNALRVLGVPVRAIVDFDALNDRKVLRSLVEGLGGEYDQELENDRRLIDNQIRGSQAPLTVGSVRVAVAEVLGTDAGAELSDAAVEIIQKLIMPDVGWRAAKRSGKYVVPPGGASIALERLITRLREIGLFIVPCGEVESFVKSVAGEGPRWVVEVIEAHQVERAAEAHTFVRDVLTSLS